MKVNSEAEEPEPVPQADVLAETVPELSTWRQRVPTPPVEEMTKLVVDAVPVVTKLLEVALVVVNPPLNASSVVVALPTNGYPAMVGVPVSCEYGSERLDNVVIEATEVVAARRLSKRVPNVVV